MTLKSTKRAVKLAAVATVSLGAMMGAGQAMASGSVAPLYGNIRPFYGNIRPFYGNIRPFWGNIRPFWGDLSPFAASTDSSDVALYSQTKTDAFWGTGNSNPYVHNPNPNVVYSQISGFWAAEAANWDQVQPLWASAQTDADYAVVAQKLQSLVLYPAVSFWGTAVLKSTKSKSVSDALAQRGCTWSQFAASLAQKPEIWP